MSKIIIDLENEHNALSLKKLLDLAVKKGGSNVAGAVVHFNNLIDEAVIKSKMQPEVPVSEKP